MGRLASSDQYAFESTASVFPLVAFTRSLPFQASLGKETPQNHGNLDSKETNLPDTIDAEYDSKEALIELKPIRRFLLKS